MYRKWIEALLFIFITSAIASCGGDSGTSTVGGGSSGGTGGGGIVNGITGSVSYTYDQNGRLSTASYGNGKTVTYQYDAAGNIKSQVVN